MIILYGPFKIQNKHLSYSKFLFDKLLKEKNIKWGIRNLEEVSHQGIIYGFIQKNIIRMPSNNFMIIYKKV